jgi:hypothetical protein
MDPRCFGNDNFRDFDDRRFRDDDVLGINDLLGRNINRLSDRELCRLFRLLSCFFCRRAFFF